MTEHPSMNARIELPDQYRDAPFRYRDARAGGLSAARLRRDDLDHPHRGVRSRAPVLDHEDLCRAFVPRMRPWHAIAGVSAALVWGLPLPPRWSSPQAVVVAVPEDRHPPTGAAVRGLRLRRTLWDRVIVSGVPVLPPLATWATLARVLTVDELLVVADALLTSADNYPALRVDRPHATADELLAFTAALRNATGASALRVAAGRARAGVESPMESELRGRLLAAGFPEPEINGEIEEQGTVLARGDLVFRDARVVVEY